MKPFQIRSWANCLSIVSDAHYELTDSRADTLHTIVWIVPPGKASLHLHTELQQSSTKALRNVLILALPGSHGTLDAKMSIASGIRDVEGRLLVQVLLFDDATISGIPALTVASDDVRASHGMSVERFRRADVFYLTSRGIAEATIDRSLILARVYSMFGDLSDDEREEVEQAVMGAIDERSNQLSHDRA